MKSVWIDSVKLPRFESQKGDLSADVLIIGGGMAGILTAFFLNQAGVKTVLVERDRIGGGTTSNTSAKITFQHGLIYSKILKSGGAEAAQKYLFANRRALEKFSEMCRDIPCDFEEKDNYVYSVSDRKRLEDEAAALEKIGCHAELTEKLPIPVRTAGAVKVSAQAQFNPLKFLAAISKDLTVYENTCVREMLGNTAVTEHGKIRAKKIVCATHFPFVNKHGSYFLKLYQHRSYVLALENAQDVGGMYVDEDHAGMSFRNYGPYLLLGGGGARTGKPCGNWLQLRNFSARVYPHATERYSWAAQDCMSLDSIPYIGHYSANTPHFFVESGFNKWGMTGSMVSAMIISDMILGKKNDFADVFNPSRSILKPQLLLNGGEAVSNLLRFSKKRCPHLGCALHWNSAEHSWDCSCHGSRFSKSGILLNNPSNEDMKVG